MARQLRIEYPGAIYHVMSRGDRKEPIFLDDGDGHDFIKTLAEACQKTGFEVHGYCLMKNHFHLRRETTLTVEQIAGRLHKGSRKSVGPKLHAWRKSNE